MSLTFALAAPVLAKALKVCADDQRLYYYVNEAIERLLANGRFRGSVARYNIRLNGGILTLPMELETCLTAARLNVPIRVRNQWFEFIGSGPGPQSRCNGSGFNLHDRGDGYVTITDIASASTLRIYADVLEAPTAAITIMGYDENNNPVRTQKNGVWQDGETIVLNPESPATFVSSAFQWNSITQIVKPATNGTVRLYAVDAHSNQTLLGLYGPNIKSPSFRRYELPGCGDARSCEAIFTLCKKRFIPVTEPNDVLIIQNLSGLKDMCKSVAASDGNDLVGKKAYEDSALDLLDKDLGEHMGDTGGTMDIQVPGFMEPVRRCYEISNPQL